MAAEDNGDIYLLTEEMGDYLFAFPPKEPKTQTYQPCFTQWKTRKGGFKPLLSPIGF